MEPVLERAADFWGDALDLDRVRFVDSSAARLTGRAFVIHDTIHWPGPPPTGADPRELAIVIHELAHCWQHQTGRWQLTRGIVEQTLYTILGWWLVALGRRPLYDPYDYGGTTGLSRAESLDALRLEAQARVFEDRFRARIGLRETPRGELLHRADGTPTELADELERLTRPALSPNVVDPPTRERPTRDG